MGLERPHRVGALRLRLSLQPVAQQFQPPRECPSPLRSPQGLEPPLLRLQLVAQQVVVEGEIEEGHLSLARWRCRQLFDAGTELIAEVAEPTSPHCIRARTLNLGMPAEDGEGVLVRASYRQRLRGQQR